MPEVVYAKSGEDWNKVFPIWDQNVENYEWRIINSILEAIAMNNRFGGKSTEELKASILVGIKEQVNEELNKTLIALQALPNPEAGMFGAKVEDINEDHQKVLDTRRNYWAEYGRWSYYLDAVFENLGGAYREYKNRSDNHVSPTVEA